jgi:hypothetical protein
MMFSLKETNQQSSFTHAMEFTDAPAAPQGRFPRIPQTIEDGRFVLFKLPSGHVKISKVSRGRLVALSFSPSQTV